MATLGRALAPRTMALSAAMLATVMTSGGGAAQTVPDDAITGAVPKAGLDIPANLQIFGKLDPNIRKPTAIVNGAVITGTDVDQRVALILAARQQTVTPDEMGQLKLAILRSLIDETLEIQQAKTADVKVTPEEINSSYDRIARGFGKDAAGMRAYLREIGSSDRSLKRQIEAELSWSRYLRRKVDINVGDEEIAAILAKLKAQQGTTEYHVREIYLSAGGDRGQEVFAQAQQIMASIQKRDKGDDTFGYYARNFSEASTKGVDGDLDWLSETQLSQLPTPLSDAVKSMTPEHLAGPIEVPGGFSIIYLVDTRRVGVADPRDSRLTLKQISVRFPAGTTQAEAQSRVTVFAKQTQGIRGCGEVAKVAASIGAEVVDNDAVKVRDLPGPLQDIMLKMQIGQSTPPFGSAEDGIRSLVLCGRDEPHDGLLPGAEQVRGQMEQQRTNLRANQLLRDLRRDAIVEYR